MTDKDKIIKLFFTKVYGKSFNDDGTQNSKHDGREGHWLEQQLGIAANGNTAPDIFGYELKKETRSKTTFGDWSPDQKVWGRKFDLGQMLTTITRDQFLMIFGQPNEEKQGRYSWSGKPAPKINKFNDFGQRLSIDQNNNIQVIYSFSEDKRENKYSIVPEQFHQDDLVIAQWSAAKLRNKLESKFGQNGWVKAHKDEAGIYRSLSFGSKLTYEDWLNSILDGKVFFDSGMYQGNSRPYSQWRANNRSWDENAVEKVTYQDFLAMGL